MYYLMKFFTPLNDDSGTYWKLSGQQLNGDWILTKMASAFSKFWEDNVAGADLLQLELI